MLCIQSGRNAVYFLHYFEFYSNLAQWITFRRALQTMQMATNEVYTGRLTCIDAYRYRFSSDRETEGGGETASVMLLIHRRFSDFLSYIRYLCCDKGADLFFRTEVATLVSTSTESPGRRFMCTRCRLLRAGAYSMKLSGDSSDSSQYMVLPTEFAMFEFDISNSDDKMLLLGPFLDLHDEFCQSPSMNDELLQGCFCIVGEISGVRMYPTPRAKRCRLVSLYLPTHDTIVEIFNAGSIDMKSHEQRYCGVFFVILFDDQVHMANLWNHGDLLWFHRPCLSTNNEEPLFGMTVENPRSSLGGKVVYQPATPIKQYLRRRSNEDEHSSTPCTTSKELLPFHMIVGTITCVSIIRTDLSIGGDFKKNDQKDDISKLCLETTSSAALSPGNLMPNTSVDILLRVIHRQSCLIRVLSSSDSRTGKNKVKRRLVVWGSMLGDLNKSIVWRIAGGQQHLGDMDCGHIICLRNVRLLQSLDLNVISGNSLPGAVRAFKFKTLAIAAIDQMFEDEIVPFVNSLASPGTTCDSISQDLTNAYMKTIVQSVSDTGLSSGVFPSASMYATVNISRLAALSTSNSICGKVTSNCGCVVGTLNGHGDCKLLKFSDSSDLSQQATDSYSSSAKRNYREMMTVNAPHDSVSVEGREFYLSVTQRIVCGIISINYSGQTVLCLVGPSTTNMASSCFSITDLSFRVSPPATSSTLELSIFTSRVDDLFYSTFSINPTTTESVPTSCLSELFLEEGGETGTESFPTMDRVIKLLKQRGYDGKIYFAESIAECRGNYK